MRLLKILFCIWYAVGVMSLSANAQEISANFQGGSVKIGPDIAPCDNGRAGAVRYHQKALYLCDGTQWGKIASSSEILGSPLMGRLVSYQDEAGFNDHNTKMDAYISAMGISEEYKNTLRAICVLPNISGPLPANYTTNSCGTYICMIETGRNPFMVQYRGFCAHGGTGGCGNKFALSWSCLNLD